jgi:dTDP-glucose pyrophosphorylase
MKVVVTAAGRGQRFRDVGIDEPKYKLEIDDRTMFEYAMSSLRDFFDEEFIFVTQRRDEGREFIHEKCASLGIDTREVVELEEVTDGQASTALTVDDRVDDGEPVAIYNIDTYVEPGTITTETMRDEGVVPVFETGGEKWSFVRTTHDDRITDVSEKEKISDLATVGFYYFGEWETLRTAYERGADDVKRSYGETYIAPLYNAVVETGGTVHAERIAADDVHVLGTPEDVVDFYLPFAEEHGLTGLTDA